MNHHCLQNGPKMIIGDPHHPVPGNLTTQGCMFSMKSIYFIKIYWLIVMKTFWYHVYTRTKKRSGSRSSARSAPVAVEAVLETGLSPERVPKLEPIDHELETDGDVTPILPDPADDQSDSDAALFLGPVLEMNLSHDSSVSASDTGQNNGK